MKNIAILIPAYNEEKYIAKVISDCLEFGLDIIVINDGSTDNTVKIIKTEHHNNLGTKIHLIEHESNFGKGQSLITGFAFIKEKKYYGVITLDADGQHDVREINDFLKKIKSEDPDLIIGNRLGNTAGMPFIRLATNVFTSRIISLISNKRVNDVQSGYRYIKTEALQKIKLQTKNFDTEPELIIKAGWFNLNIVNIPIKTIYHEDFVSYVNPITDTIKFFKLVFKSMKWKKNFKNTGSKN